jgi:co-chaperonin GroES (HSP10)
VEKMNQSGLRPLGRAVLCKPYEPEIASSKIHIPEPVRQRGLMNEMRATVLEIGPDAWAGQARRAEVGDKVLISKWAGVIVHGTLDGEPYRMCNDEDIFCAIDAEDFGTVRAEEPLLAGAKR